jgi:hypothetical protein
MDEITEQLAIRDRLRRKLSLAKTPIQRMHEMALRLHACSDWPPRSSEGYQRFLRRNRKARAIDVRELHDG